KTNKFETDDNAPTAATTSLQCELVNTIKPYKLGSRSKTVSRVPAEPGHVKSAVCVSQFSGIQREKFTVSSAVYRERNSQSVQRYTEREIHSQFCGIQREKFTVSSEVHRERNSQSVLRYTEREIHSQFSGIQREKFTVSSAVHRERNSQSVQRYTEREIHSQFSGTQREKFTVSSAVHRERNSQSVQRYTEREIHSQFTGIQREKFTSFFLLPSPCCRSGRVFNFTQHTSVKTDDVFPVSFHSEQD
ncbi:hypothetical protein BaRGS_00036178, partial [Batillaria attramentaria]